MMLLQIACMLMLMTGSALSLSSTKSIDIPNYLKVILASYKAPKETFQKESDTQKMETSVPSQSIPTELDSLLQLRRDLYEAYNLTYQIKDPNGRILYRNEYSDGTGSLRGSMNFANSGSKMTVISYSVKVEEHPIPSPEPGTEQMLTRSMRSPMGENQISEESFIQEEQTQILTVSRAPPKLKSASMDKNGKIFQEDIFLTPLSGTKEDDDFDDLQAFSSLLVEDKEYLPDEQSDDISGSAMRFHMKPKARGYKQVWKKGQGLVVNKEYELPESYDYRSAISHRAEPEEDENEEPLYVFKTKPAIKVFEVSRDLDGNYQMSEEYNYNMKKHGLEEDHGEEPLYIDPTKVQVMQMSSDGDDSLVFGNIFQGFYPNDYDEFDSHDRDFPSFKKLQQSA